MTYARGVIKKYDANGDGVLIKNEWVKMKRTPEAADTNKDGKVDDKELATWMSKR